MGESLMTSLIYLNISMIFFTYIGPNLAKRIPKVDINPLSFMKEALKETLFLSPVTETKINHKSSKGFCNWAWW